VTRASVALAIFAKRTHFPPRGSRGKRTANPWRNRSHRRPKHGRARRRQANRRANPRRGQPSPPADPTESDLIRPMILNPNELRAAESHPQAARKGGLWSQAFERSEKANCKLPEGSRRQSRAIKTVCIPPTPTSMSQTNPRIENFLRAIADPA